MTHRPSTRDDDLSGTTAAVEREVLGALLRGVPVDPIRALMPADEFDTAAHQIIAATIYALADDGRPVCPTAVLEDLQARRLVGRINPSILLDLFRDCQIPAAGVYFAERARRYATMRALRTLGQQLADMTSVTDLDDVPDLCRNAFARITDTLNRLEQPDAPAATSAAQLGRPAVAQAA